MRNKVLLIAAILIVVLAGVAAAVVNNSNKDDNSTESATHSENQSAEQHSENTASQQQSQEQTATETTEVKISNYAYSPATIKVKVGQTVTWTNQDSVQHDVVDDNDSADGPKGPLLAKGESYSFTFKKAGTFNYHCTPHSYMKGTVEVTE